QSRDVPRGPVLPAAGGADPPAAAARTARGHSVIGAGVRARVCRGERQEGQRFYTRRDGIVAALFLAGECSRAADIGRARGGLVPGGKNFAAGFAAIGAEWRAR